MSGFGRGSMAVQAVLVVRALDAAGSQGLDWRGVAAALRDAWEGSGQAHETTGSDRCPVRRNAYRWMSALEATLLYEVCAPGEYAQPGVSSRIRLVKRGQPQVEWRLVAVPDVSAKQRAAGRRAHPWRETAR